ncbi:MAG: hypothetical protein CM15mP125_4430 [Gammaproteobacteria bacterium]|nr:MAG: hypothetical protein CM15mP125_4430 [Gammaproteobacteria bacterium]
MEAPASGPVRDDISPQVAILDRIERFLGEGDHPRTLFGNGAGYRQRSPTNPPPVTTFLTAPNRHAPRRRCLPVKNICRTFCTGKSRCKWAPPPHRDLLGNPKGRAFKGTVCRPPAMPIPPPSTKTWIARIKLGISVYRFKGVVVFPLFDRHNFGPGSGLL